MDDAELQHSLDELAANPEAALDRVPVKRDAAGKVLERPLSLFSTDDIATGDFVRHRDELRRRFHALIDGRVVALENLKPGKAPIESSDRPEQLVGKVPYRTLAEMEAHGLLSAALDVLPWSDDYWPFYLGCIARRYADPHFPKSRTWSNNYEYAKSHPAQEIVDSGSTAAINQLSPAEKYDLLMGDRRFTLTAAMWEQGKEYADRKGKVEKWMGICHGWAPASYMVSRPSKEVIVLAADGQTRLRFYPSDIKALISLLWANADYPVKMVGGRTDVKKPRLDDHGRVVNDEAFDPNPGTWHMVVVTQLGVLRRCFVMDTTYDYEIWNQPVCSYEYRYFNPQTMQLVQDLQSATVPRDAYTRDRFREHRGRNAASFVGVIMKVGYIVETDPDHRTTDQPSRSDVNTVTYKYDLELDEQGRIVGGEWHVGRTHPDFLWTPLPDVRVTTAADSFAKGDWSLDQPVPEEWRKAALRASELAMPLAKVVEALVRLANS